MLEEEEALTGLLAYLEEKPAVAGNLYVFVCGDNKALMSLDSENEVSVGEYLTGILENNLEGKPKDAVTLQDLYNAWHRGEEMPKLPIAEAVNKRPVSYTHLICPVFCSGKCRTKGSSFSSFKSIHG